MLDVITTVSERTPRGWLSQCRRSIRLAASEAGFAVEVTESAGVDGHIGRGYEGGYSKSRQPWVTWVDDDDFVLPHAFAVLGDVLHRDDIDAIYAREIALGANGRLIPLDRRHHLAVWRRTALESFDWAAHPARLSMAMQAVIDEARAIDLRCWVYVYRQYRSAGMRLRRVYQ